MLFGTSGKTHIIPVPHHQVRYLLSDTLKILTIMFVHAVNNTAPWLKNRTDKTHELIE